MLRRLLITVALVAMLGTAVPRAEAATTATMWFNGVLNVGWSAWYVHSNACGGTAFDIQRGFDTLCNFSAFGAASGSCTVLDGPVRGQVNFFSSGTLLDYTGTVTVTTTTGHPTLTITGLATNTWTGKVAWVTAAIHTMSAGSGCSTRILQGAFNVTPVI